MVRTVILFVICIISFAASAYDQSDLWLQKSYGEYKVKIFRVLGEAHAFDYVEVDIYKVSDDGKKTFKQTVKLPTPSYKGYVRDVQFHSIGKERVAITFQIEMKAMDGVVLPELFIMERSGKYERVIEAKSVDLYKDM